MPKFWELGCAKKIEFCYRFWRTCVTVYYCNYTVLTRVRLYVNYWSHTSRAVWSPPFPPRGSSQFLYYHKMRVVVINWKFCFDIYTPQAPFPESANPPMNPPPNTDPILSYTADFVNADTLCYLILIGRKLHSVFVSEVWQGYDGVKDW